MANILIIDDDRQFRTMLRKMIEKNGHDVIEAPDGREGVRLYRKSPTDLIITDLIMPEKDGIETIQELKKDFPDIKIIAVSGGGRLGPRNYLHLAKMLGAQRTLTKPIELPELLDAIKEVLAESDSGSLQK
ncbi:MAG: response regulator [Deltaproteobacteria bacterium]|jgi:CheY-like chemotaxis protein|nr:response regulator [Deltaproteobacteria bacterium]